MKWSSNEALRLAVWLVAQADEGFYKGPKEIDLASQKVIDDNLIRLWGLKLGKASSNEAYSSRWILAALSDFNGQLQARDIIRFLQYATVPNGTVRTLYVGNFGGGQFNDESGSAWMIGNVKMNGAYSYYKGPFKNNESEKDRHLWEYDISKERINEIISEQNFKFNLLWEIPRI